MSIELGDTARAAVRKQRLLAVVSAFVVAAGAGGLRLAAQTDARSGSGLTVIAVRPNIYMIAGAGGNVAVHIGRDGVIVTDTGTADKAALLLAEIKRLTTLPIRYIINTSADRDHVGGNEILAKAGIPLSQGPGTPPSAPILAEERVLRRMSAPTGAQAAFPADAWPNATYSFAAKERQRKLMMNGDSIQVMAQPAAHTDGDSLVYFRQSEVLVTGDVLDTTRFPVIDTARGGSIQGLLDSLNRIIDMTFSPAPFTGQYPDDGTRIIPGHGSLSGQTEVVDYRDMVTIIRDRVAALIKEGKTLAQIQQANPTQGWRRQYGSDSGNWTTAMFVEAIYNGLTKSGR